MRSSILWMSCSELQKPSRCSGALCSPYCWIHLQHNFLRQNVRFCSFSNQSQWSDRTSASYKMTFITQWLEITWMAKVINSLNMGTSILITVLVIFYLQRGRTGFRKTDNIINRLIIFSVNTGLLTSICSTLATIFVSNAFDTFHCGVVWPSSSTAFIPNIFLGNCLAEYFYLYLLL